MKKSILVLAFALVSVVGFSQRNKTAVPKLDSAGQTALGKVDTEPKMFALFLSPTDLAVLYMMILKADNFTEKGRLEYLEELKKHTLALPKDSAVKK